MSESEADSLDNLCDENEAAPNDLREGVPELLQGPGGSPGGLDAVKRERIVIVRDKKIIADLERKLDDANKELLDLRNQRMGMRARCEILHAEVARQKKDLMVLLEKDSVNDTLIEELARRISSYQVRLFSTVEIGKRAQYSGILFGLTRLDRTQPEAKTSYFLVAAV